MILDDVTMSIQLKQKIDISFVLVWYHHLYQLNQNIPCLRDHAN